MATVEFHRDPNEFWRLTEPLFTADPIRNTIPITVLHGLRNGQRFTEAAPVLCTIHENGTVVGAAFRTPPFPLMVTGLPARFAGVVADELLASGLSQDGASGARPKVEAFASAWAERTGDEIGVRMELRLFRLGELVPPSDVPGSASVGTEAEIELLADWRQRFIAEANPGHPEPLADSVRAVRNGIASGDGHLLWRVDGEPVSMAAVGAPLRGMSRLAPVYTPPELRGHGYGSAVTAAASRWALDQGAGDVVLFTDLANPTSNSIYQRIGYRAVEDAREVSFTPRNAPASTDT